MESFLLSLETENPIQWSEGILTDDDLTEPIELEMTVDPREFEDRQQLGQYLNDILEAAGATGVERDRGMWAWLAYFYFHQLCPTDGSGNLKPGEMARWIPAFSDFRKYYRHLVAAPYRIYRAYRDDPELVRAILCTPPHSPGELTEQLASRQELVTNRAVMEVSTALYVDPETRQPKRGARGSGAGSVRRLAAVLLQFDMTWDLYAMTAHAIQDMLPDEFARYQ